MDLDEAIKKKKMMCYSSALSELMALSAVLALLSLGVAKHIGGELRVRLDTGEGGYERRAV